MVSKSDIAEVLSKYLQDLFDLPTEKLGLSARLSDDLDMDSIDAIDLVVKLQEYTGRKIRRRSSRASEPSVTLSTRFMRRLTMVRSLTSRS